MCPSRGCLASSTLSLLVSLAFLPLVARAVSNADLIDHLGGTVTGQSLTTVAYTLTVVANDQTALVSCSWDGKVSEAGWIAVGRGTAMTDADMIILWFNSENTWTLSHRTAESTVMPTLVGFPSADEPSSDASGQVKVVAALSSKSADESPTVVTFERPLVLKGGYDGKEATLEKALNQPFIYAVGPANPGDVAQDTDLKQHALDSMGATYIDLSAGFTADTAAIEAPITPVKESSGASSAKGEQTATGTVTGAEATGTKTANDTSGTVAKDGGTAASGDPTARTTGQASAGGTGGALAPSSTASGTASSSSGLAYADIIKYHGICGGATWAFSAPLGVLWARFGRTAPRLFPLHFWQQGLLTTLLTLMTVGLAFCAVSSKESSTSTTHPHKIIGWGFVAAVLLQDALGLWTHTSHGPRGTGRKIQGWLHIVLGVALISIGFFQVHLGMERYGVSDGFLTYAYYGLVAVFVLLYSGSLLFGLEFEGRIAGQQLHQGVPSFEAFGLNEASHAAVGATPSALPRGAAVPGSSLAVAPDTFAPYPAPEQPPPAPLQAPHAAHVGYSVPPVPQDPLAFLSAAALTTPPLQQQHPVSQATLHNYSQAHSHPSAPSSHDYALWLALNAAAQPHAGAAPSARASFDPQALPSNPPQAVVGLAQFRSASGDAGQPYAQHAAGGPATYDPLAEATAAAARARQANAPDALMQGVATATFPQQVESVQSNYAVADMPGPALPTFESSMPAAGKPSMQALFKQYWQAQPAPLPSPQGTASSLGGMFDAAAMQAMPQWMAATSGWPTPDATPQSSFPAQMPAMQHGSFDAGTAYQPIAPQHPFPIPSPSLNVPVNFSPTALVPSGVSYFDSAPSQASLEPAPFAAASAEPTTLKRTRTSASSAGRGSARPRAPSRSTSQRGPINPNKKLTEDLHVACIVCAEPLARLILRGKRAELDVPHSAVFTCQRCLAAATPPEDAVAEASTSKAKVKKPGFRKRNKRFDDASATTACDVCLRDIAVGGVLPLPLENPPPGTLITFMIEVVCVSCDVKYRRCSDCGGGGGSRAGTGKWRCAELFPPGRKTCCLRHQRLGAFPAMEYNVWRNTEIPDDEKDALSAECEAMFVNAMLSGLCIPEVMEQDGAVWSTFAAAQQHAKMGWLGFDPIIRHDVEAERQIRRYVALRTCTPNLRKTNKPGRKASTATGADDASATESPEPSISPEEKKSGVVLKEGKEVAGFIIAEHELLVGNLFLCIVLPWDPTGEIFDATSLLIASLVRHVDGDIKATNAARAVRGEQPYPELARVWTMLFFKRDSRVLTSLVKKRGFMYLEDYLRAHPNVPSNQFPPHRPCYLPVERQAGWEVLVREQRQMADGSVDDWGARRAADEERGKKKELRAKAQAAAALKEKQDG
ncbi:uncharacterized protein JCM10292_004502 [Rhodotorula paludigena]|uniref:uncharacterized protein n=1 Tax=Rhodotorula paludigena TaxID=86838 RepID=UPI00316F48C2